MSYRKLAILGIVAAAMALWTMVLSHNVRRPAAGGFIAGGTLLQGFDPAAIGSIVLKSDGKQVTLARQGALFVVAEKDHYPAKMSQINYLITMCLDIKTNEYITSEKANFSELGVGDEKPATSVTFLKPDKSVIAGILIGKRSSDMQGAYVRLASSDKVYLSTNAPPLSMGAMDFIQNMLTEHPSDDVAMVKVEAPMGGYVITKEPNRGAVLVDAPPPGKRVKQNEVDQIFAALNNLSFDDVRKDPGNLKFDRTYTCQLRNSTVYTVTLASKAGKTFAKCAADFLDKSAVVKKTGVESEAELKAKETKLLARDQAAVFAKRTEGWIYEIPPVKAKAMTMTLAELIEDEPAKPPAGSAKP
jgi:hypothetical protein